MTPSIFGEGGTPKSWVMVLDKLSAMHPRFIVPDHGELGDESLIAKERDFLNAIGVRATQLKRQGVSAEDAVPRITEEFKKAYPDYPNMNPLPNLVKLAYAEVN